MDILNKVVFRIKTKEVKVRDIALIVMVLLLLLLLWQCNKPKTVEEKKEDKLSDVCVFPKRNLNELNLLLLRADFCSSNWFKDYDVFLQDLEDQNALLKGKSDKQKEVYNVQTKLIKSLKKFKENQTEETLNDVEKAIKNYKKVAQKGCDDL